jgi:hypothetical protein
VKTAKEIADYFLSLPAGELIALPIIWDKALAHEEFRIATGESVKMTDEQWSNVIDRYNNAEVYDNYAMFVSIADELDLDVDELELGEYN